MLVDDNPNRKGRLGLFAGELSRVSFRQTSRVREQTFPIRRVFVNYPLYAKCCAKEMRVK